MHHTAYNPYKTTCQHVCRHMQGQLNCSPTTAAAAATVRLAAAPATSTPLLPLQGAAFAPPPCCTASVPSCSQQLAALRVRTHFLPRFFRKEGTSMRPVGTSSFTFGCAAAGLSTTTFGLLPDPCCCCSVGMCCRTGTRPLPFWAAAVAAAAGSGAGAACWSACRLCAYAGSFGPTPVAMRVMLTSSCMDGSTTAPKMRWASSSTRL